MREPCLALVLHAHLPFVRHPEHEVFLEEEWFFEAVTESYVPLIRSFRALAAEGVPFRLTLSLSPTLTAMLRDPLLGGRYLHHLDRLSSLVEHELRRTRTDPRLHRLARHYRRQLQRTIATWRELDGDLVAALAGLQRQGHLELLTCAATHGYLPLLQVTPRAVSAQVQVAVANHKLHVGRAPRGIWLPECAYAPGLDEELARAGLRHFVADAHGLLLARPRPRYGTTRPIFCPRSGVAVFGRDPETSLQVWSRRHGYPGDPHYREFYRDIGFDLDLDHVGPWVQPDGQRKFTGIKYHRITGPTEEKDLYDPAEGQRRASAHAADFLRSRARQVEQAARSHGVAPIIVAPYDAELFGHWWYEGPSWLEAVLRGGSRSDSPVRLTTLEGYLAEAPTHQVCQPAQSSWGNGGFHAFWLDRDSEWLYPHLHRAAETMERLARANPGASGLRRRALDQAARELLLAQASDWPFIIRNGTSVQYAVQRCRSHLRRFARLSQDLDQGSIDEEWLGQVEYIDPIFQEIDYAVYG